MMYPHAPYYGIAPPYFGFVGIAPLAMPPPVTATPPVVPTPVTIAPVVTTTSETPVVPYVREKPPVTTVFVGNISERAPDQLIKTLLMRCGNILSWKRVQGASGKLQAFGFCEYEDPESTMRCVRILNGFNVGDKKLLVKVDPKTEDLLNEYRKKKEETGEKGTLGATAEEIDSSTLRDDESVKSALEAILKENSAVLDGSESPRKLDTYLEGPRHLTMEDMDLDDDRKDLINREIEIFRKRNEKEDQNDSSHRRTKPRDSERSSSGLQLYAAYVENDRREREYRKDKTRGGRSRSRSGEHKRSRGKSQVVDEEEEAIRKKLERKLREKEESYQKRLKQWETRERKKANEYEHEREHEIKRQRELQIEAQRLKEFFEDYDDMVEDPKYYRGSALHQRLKDRELEEAADERDRQKEMEQIEVARRKLIEEKDPNAESIIFQMEQKMQEHLRKRLNTEGTEPTGGSESDNEDVERPLEAACREEQQAPNDVQKEDEAPESAHTSPRSQCDSRDVPVSGPSLFQPTEFASAPTDEASVNLPKDGSSTFLFAMTPAEPVVRKKAAAFTEDEPEEKSKKHTPSWLPPSAFSTATTGESNSAAQPNGIDSMSAAAMVATLTSEERNALIKKIIKGIPTAKRDIFSYPIDWDMIDATFINTRIKPWVDKKIISYIGEAEATLSNFICDQLLRHSPPERILADIAMVLDEEAEVFVVKMWRLLIYVIAEKKAGLST
ncbi:Rna binding motif protein 25 [Paragonimus heterotremus]|uniref:Rna binding motif protein 25 n=1 Tax=Paragonimus heterotremus TaxID=100268 RepID=A0A8J4T1X1_9TREM|nr:Rna binding motif protein 25 [Paragonimus heterotremus]